MNAAALLASKAYSNTGASLGVNNGPKIAEANNFSNLLAAQISNTIEASKGAEQQAAQAAIGKAELVDVVTAISAAEVQMETMIAFRDQAIQAYQEISRMPI